MLPTIKSAQPSLAEVLPSCFAALGNEKYANVLSLPFVESVVLVVVDGLGYFNLKDARAHARFLWSAAEKSTVLGTVFPSTTASALTSLMTSVGPGKHGILGYKIRDPKSGEIINQLSGIATAQEQPWLLAPPQSVDSPVNFAVVSHKRFKESTLTKTIYAGATFIGATSLDERVDAVIEQVKKGTTLTLLYISELDELAHKNGAGSSQWAQELEHVDAQMRRLSSRLSSKTGVLITADHGIIDVPAPNHVLLGSHGELEDVEHVGGEPRCLQLYLRDPLSAGSVLQKLTQTHQAHVSFFSRGEVIDSGLLGEMTQELTQRIGDIFAFAHDGYALYDIRDNKLTGRNMIGQHGGLMQEEMRIPAIRLAGFTH